MRGRLRDASVLMAMVLAQGCLPQVPLAAPPPRTAPAAQRLAYYQAHRPTGLEVRTTLLWNRFGAAGGPTALEGVWLGNGTLVRRAEDLRELVEPGSPTSQHLDRMERARELSTGLLVGGAAAAAVGLGLLVPGITRADRDDRNDGLLWTSVGLTLAGSVLTLVAAYGPGARASEARLGAFATLDASLRRRLDLCERPPLVVDCAEAAAPPTPPLPAPWATPPPASPAPVPQGLLTPITM